MKLFQTQELDTSGKREKDPFFKFSWTDRFFKGSLSVIGYNGSELYNIWNLVYLYVAHSHIYTHTQLGERI